MAGEHDDLVTLMDYAEVALQLGGDFPSHDIGVTGTGSGGLQFAAKRKSMDGPGPYFYQGSADGLREALGGKPGV